MDFVTVVIKIYYWLIICEAVVTSDSSLTPLNLNVSLAIMPTNSTESLQTQLRDSV